MKKLFGGAVLAGLLILSRAGMVPSGARMQGQNDESVRDLGPGFSSATAKVNGISLHYVRGGEGPAVILIHGFPQDWYEYHAIMPALAKQLTVIAVDLRGIGGSSPAAGPEAGGYDAANMAKDVMGLVQALKLERVYVVGHDIGGMVAYAYLRQFPRTLRGMMILDVPIPGVAPKDIQCDPHLWHVGFMQVPGLAEKLVDGRQADYFAYFFQFGKITPAEADHFVKAYPTASLHAMFEIYRAFPENEKFNAARSDQIGVPLFVAMGEGSPFAKIVTQMAESLRAHGCVHVDTGIIPGGVHYVVEDQPEEVAEWV
jgi:pimeloyl-ACP methyl ester carboxylesterase